MHRLRSSPTARHRGWWAALLLAVVLAQWLALAHSVVHGRGLPVIEYRAPEASTLVDLLAGHDAGSATCQLLDQLAHASPGFEAPQLAAPAPLPDAWVASIHLAPSCRVSWAYRARAPPPVQA